MRPSFHPRLVNGPFDDPGLFIPFAFENRAILFDLGDLSALSSRDILKLSHIFVTHTHMDHFIGFDRLLRLHLGRGKRLYLYGPEEFLGNIEGKLAGYTWNLVENYDQALDLTVTEVSETKLLSRSYRCRNRFADPDDLLPRPFEGTLHQEPALSVSAAILDHGMPCLGFSLAERFHVNIIKERVFELGLTVGPWMGSFKQALYDGRDPASHFEIFAGGAGISARRFVLGELTDHIALITPGQKITYIADSGAGDANRQKIIDLAKDADQLFIEAAFLEKDKQMAEKKSHLTARLAGRLAAEAGVKQFVVFHFSPRYAEQGHLLEEEARQAWIDARGE